MFKRCISSFSDRDGVHRDLHSFPTRRSSDLPIHYPESDGAPTADSTLQFRWIVTLKGNLDAGTAARSEEHTSELQSRRDLVCRLLLEKKNNVRRLAGTESSRAASERFPSVIG